MGTRKTAMPTKEEFQAFFVMLIALGFERMERAEVIKRLRLSSKRHTLKKKSDKYVEDGYKLTYGMKTIVVWTSFLPEIGEAREGDFIWVELFNDEFPSEKPCFSSFNIRRTKAKTTFKRALRWAECFVEMVHHWPAPCEECGRMVTLRLVPDWKELHQVAFFCPADRKHKLSTMHWVYQGSSEKNREFMEKYFRDYSEYREKNPNAWPFRFSRAGYEKPKDPAELFNDLDNEQRFPETVYEHKD